MQVRQCPRPMSRSIRSAIGRELTDVPGLSAAVIVLNFVIWTSEILDRLAVICSFTVSFDGFAVVSIVKIKMS